MEVRVVHNTERNLAHRRMDKADLPRVRVALGEHELYLGAHEERRVRQVPLGVEVAGATLSVAVQSESIGLTLGYKKRRKASQGRVSTSN